MAIPPTASSTSGPLGNRAAWLKLVRGNHAQPMYDFTEAADDAGVTPLQAVAELETYYLTGTAHTLQ